MPKYEPCRISTLGIVRYFLGRNCPNMSKTSKYALEVLNFWQFGHKCELL